MSDDKYGVAHHAVLTWMAETGVTTDERFTYAQKCEYADRIAMQLVMQEGTRDAIVNDMELIHTTFGYSIRRIANR